MSPEKHPTWYHDAYHKLVENYLKRIQDILKEKNFPDDDCHLVCNEVLSKLAEATKALNEKKYKKVVQSLDGIDTKISEIYINLTV